MKSIRLATEQQFLGCIERFNRPSAIAQWSCLLLLAACGGSGGDGNGGGSNTETYTVSASVTGLTGTGLVLQNNGGDNLATSNNASVTFAIKLPDGAAYSVTVLTQPINPAQTCAVTNGNGTVAGANVTTPVVTCTDPGDSQFGSGPDPIPEHSGNPTSADVIDAALVAGTITKEQAILYQMYAQFGDSRLPQEYRGDDVGLIEGDGYDRAAAYVASIGESNLSPATTEALRPFFTPPYYQGSWWQQRDAGAVTTFSAKGTAVPAVKAVKFGVAPLATPTKIGWTAVTGTNVVVWYRDKHAATDAGRASILLNEYETNIWPKLTTLMGRTPKSDLGTGGLLDLGLAWTEDDGRLDVFLDDLSGTLEGRTQSAVPWKGKDTAARIFLKRTLPMHGLLAQAAHELMHAIQYSYDVAASSIAEYRTTKEATAAWASHYIYPGAHWESKYAKSYFAEINNSYDDKATSESFPYGAYVFPLFLETKFSPSIIKAIWDKTLTRNTELPAIGDAIGGAGSTFEDTWREFIPANWNKETLDTYRPFGVTDQPANSGDSAMTQANGYGEARHAIDLPHASMAYIRLTLAASDRSLLFINGMTYTHRTKDGGAGLLPYFEGRDASNRKGVSMQLYLKVNGSWQSKAVDISNVPWVAVCRDDPAGKIEEVIFMYGNGEIDPSGVNYAKLLPPLDPPGLIATDIGCRDWTGSLDLQRVINSGTGIETIKINGIKLVNAISTAAPTPAMSAPPYMLAPGVESPAPFGFIYKVSAGTADWTYDETINGCINTGRKNFSIVGAGKPLIGLANWAPPGNAFRGMSIPGFMAEIPFTIGQLPVNYTCTHQDGSTTSGTKVVLTRLDATSAPPYLDATLRVKSGGLSIVGTGAHSHQPGATGTWSLTGSTK